MGSGAEPDELNLRAFEDERRSRLRRYAGHPEAEKLAHDGFAMSTQEAKKAWAEKDIFGVMCFLGNTYHLSLVLDNLHTLKELGLYEEALLHAYSSTRANHAGWQPSLLKFMFCHADRAKLIEAGDPLPGEGPFTVYRGVAGRGAKRRIRAISWTASLDRAIWFAKRYAKFPEMEKPMVYQAIVPLENVYAYDNGREEQEFLCDIPKRMKLKKVWP